MCMCHVSDVMCHMLCVTCCVSHFCFVYDIVVELVGQESVINTGPTTNLKILHKFAMYGMVHFLLVLMTFFTSFSSE